jgi:hypothetical protein
VHFEVPEKVSGGLRSFFGHYAMIVVSILTALSLEEAAQYVHHRHAGEQAAERIETELRANLKEVEASLANNIENNAPVGKLDRALVEALRAGKPGDEIQREVIAKHSDGVRISLSWPSLFHEAWDVAVANQSAAYMDPERMRRYSSAYSAQHDVETVIARAAASLHDGTRWIDTSVDLELGHPDPLALLRTVRQTQVAVSMAQGNLREYRDALRKALGEPLAAPASTPSSH